MRKFGFVSHFALNGYWAVADLHSKILDTPPRRYNFLVPFSAIFGQKKVAVPL